MTVFRITRPIKQAAPRTVRPTAGVLGPPDATDAYTRVLRVLERHEPHTHRYLSQSEMSVRFVEAEEKARPHHPGFVTIAWPPPTRPHLKDDSESQTLALILDLVQATTQGWFRRHSSKQWSKSPEVTTMLEELVAKTETAAVIDRLRRARLMPRGVDARSLYAHYVEAAKNARQALTLPNMARHLTPLGKAELVSEGGDLDVLERRLDRLSHTRRRPAPRRSAPPLAEQP